MKKLIIFLWIPLLFPFQRCKNSNTEKKNKKEKNDVVWVADSMSGILGNENIKINFATGYSPIVFENRPEEVVLRVGTNDALIGRITKFKVNNALILAMEVCDTSKRTGVILKDVGVGGIQLD